MWNELFTSNRILEYAQKEEIRRYKDDRQTTLQQDLL